MQNFSICNNQSKYTGQSQNNSGLATTSAVRVCFSLISLGSGVVFRSWICKTAWERLSSAILHAAFSHPILFFKVAFHTSRKKIRLFQLGETTAEKQRQNRKKKWVATCER